MIIKCPSIEGILLESRGGDFVGQEEINRNIGPVGGRKGSSFLFYLLAAVKRTKKY